MSSAILSSSLFGIYFYFEIRCLVGCKNSVTSITASKELIDLLIIDAIGMNWVLKYLEEELISEVILDQFP
jgi:hypothetical protein